MGNYKVKVNGNIEELISLFIALGCKYFNHTVTKKNYMIVEDGKAFFCNLKSNFKKSACQEVTIDQLRDMVVLKRNDVGDATHIDQYGHKWIRASGVWHFYTCGKKWDESLSRSMSRYELKPITKEPVMKEFLAKDESGSYFLFNSEYPKASEWIEVPEGSMFATGSDVIFRKNNYIFDDGAWELTDVTIDNANFYGLNITWQRETQPEALPFIDDEVHEAEISNFKIGSSHAHETLSDQVASAEVARQKFITPFDTQISGDHYKLLPIQPMKFALANGLDYAQGNVIKYVIRHASKNGKDDLLKAIHNIELMIEHYYG